MRPCLLLNLYFISIARFKIKYYPIFILLSFVFFNARLKLNLHIISLSYRSLLNNLKLFQFYLFIFSFRLVNDLFAFLNLKNEIKSSLICIL